MQLKVIRPVLARNTRLVFLLCGEHLPIKELIDYDQFCGIAPAEPVGNPDEVTGQDMKKALDNPSQSYYFHDKPR